MKVGVNPKLRAIEIPGVSAFTDKETVMTSTAVKVLVPPTAEAPRGALWAAAAAAWLWQTVRRSSRKETAWTS